MYTKSFGGKKLILFNSHVHVFKKIMPQLSTLFLFNNHCQIHTTTFFSFRLVPNLAAVKGRDFSNHNVDRQGTNNLRVDSDLCVC